MKIVYVAQFRDTAGYAVAARGYLSALDEYLKENPDAFELKIYSTVITESNNLSPEELSLIEKYEFQSDDEIDKMVRQRYTFLWHMPTPLLTFADDKFRPSPNCSPSILKLQNASDRNISICTWETDSVPWEWKKVYEYYHTDKIIVPCEWNKEPFREAAKCATTVIPHVIEENKTPAKKLDLPVDLDDKFTVLSISQWTKRKGFDILIRAWAAEFNKEDDAILILKAYASGTHGVDAMQNEIRYYKHDMVNPKYEDPVDNNIILIPGFLPFENINWLYENSDVFALTSRGEGFGLPIAEALTKGLPVLVPKEGGHTGYIHKDAAFLVDGHWDTCLFNIVPYENDGEWYECHINSTRKQLRKAYNLWKHKREELKAMGNIGRDNVLSGEYSPLKIGEMSYETVKSSDEAFVHTSLSGYELGKVKKKRLEIKSKLLKLPTLEEKVELLKDSFEGETCYILSCGPSLSDYDPDFLREKLKNKLVLSVKQAYETFPDITDFHFFNCANMPPPMNPPLWEHYVYDKMSPVTIASSNYAHGQRWSRFQKNDLFFKVPIRTEINNEFLSVTKDFEKYTLDNQVERPCGPGIMYETVLYAALHLGVKKIVALGWDLCYNNPKELDDYEHFFGSTESLHNRGDILDWEIDSTREASEHLYKWLKERGVELELASDKSSLYKKIPRVQL